MRARGKPRITRRRKFLPEDRPTKLQRCMVKFATWELITKLAGDWGVGAGIDALAEMAELLMQREREKTASVNLSSGINQVTLEMYP
jgi:hypothetical protein